MEIFNKDYFITLENIADKHNAHSIPVLDVSLNFIIPGIKLIKFGKNVLVSEDKFSFSIGGYKTDIEKFKQKHVISKIITFNAECLQFVDEVMINLFNNIDYQFVIDEYSNDYNIFEDKLKNRIKICDPLLIKSQFVNYDKYAKGLVRIKNNSDGWKTIGWYYVAEENNSLVYCIEFNLHL
jgi:hypothetical protein